MKKVLFIYIKADITMCGGMTLSPVVFQPQVVLILGDSSSINILTYIVYFIS